MYRQKLKHDSDILFSFGRVTCVSFGWTMSEQYQHLTALVKVLFFFKVLKHEVHTDMKEL